MKKVTLLGDSIRQLGYGAKVAELLKNEYTVFQPDDNCRFAKYTLRGLFDWKAQIAGSDVIHWNNGLWDVSNLFGDGFFSSPEEYKSNILSIAEQLLKNTPNVIFATTTPVRSDYPYQNNADIEMFNGLVVPELKKMGVVINDLYGTVYPKLDEFIRADDNIHLTEQGIAVCARQVIASIKKVGENK